MFPNAVFELNYKTPFQFLVAVILSAQCTDSRVNMITPALFKKFSTPQDFANAKVEEIEELIKSCGFYHNKAKSIKNASIDIINKFNGELPKTIQEMMTLSGVGMKTAKVVCGDIYGDDVIAVDTHVLRISNRIGLVEEKDPNRCSLKLEKLLKKDLPRIHHRLVLFGRYHCKAKNPNCRNCEIKDFCKYYNKTQKEKNDN